MLKRSAARESVADRADDSVETENMSGTRLKGKRALVTGAARGLGQAIARRFVLEGGRVVCLDIRAQLNESCVESIRSLGPEDAEVQAVSGDVGDSGQVERMVEESESLLGGIDVLVNNAGVIPSRKSVVETPEADWDETFRVNAKGVFLMSQAVIPRMIEQGGGSIINMSSIGGLVGLPVRMSYCATKGAVSLLTRQMAVDFGKDNVRVNAINPSYIVTDLTREMLDRLKADPPTWQRFMDQHPLGRLGEPEDVAQAAVFLASDESKWVTGVLLPVDGGYTAH